MKLSLRYFYTKVLAFDMEATIADEYVAPLNIQWIGVASTRFASHAGFLYFVSSESEVPSPPLDPQGMFGFWDELLLNLCRYCCNRAQDPS